MKKKSKLKKVICITLGVLFSVIIIIGITIAALWHNEIASVASIKMIVNSDEENKSAPVYEIKVSGGYYFDKFIENGGVSNDQELIDFIVGNITKGIIPISLNAPTIGCSSFTGQTSEGDRLFGRNYDFSTTTGMVVHTNPGKGRYSSISSVDLQFLGINDGASLDSLMQKLICLAVPYIPLDGMNEKGVSCGIYMSYQGSNDKTATNQNTDAPDITSTTMLRMILDYAASVDEAIELVQKYDLHDSANTSFHYMVADSTGKSAILEWVNGTKDTDNDGSLRNLNVIYNDDDSSLGEKEGNNDFQYVTNFIVTPNYYNESNTKFGLDRYNEIEAMMNPNGDNTSGVITKENALGILQRVGRRNWDKVTGASDKNTITVWSVLYDMTNKTVTWVSNEQFDVESSVFTYTL